MSAEQTRQKIVETADQLFYEQGFEATSFANISNKTNISRGNFYYHFKTKDQILEAVIAHRLHMTRDMVDRWQQDGRNPADRVSKFIDILIVNRSLIKEFGCPVGTLCSELGKLSHPAMGSANELFTLFRHWLRGQFEEMGHGPNADQLAMHVLARSQGVATLAQAFHDEDFIWKEVRLLQDWLADLSNSQKG